MPTTASHPPSLPLQIRLSNFKAIESDAKGDRAPDRSQCIFVQGYQQLRAVPTTALRVVRDEGQEKVRAGRGKWPCCSSPAPRASLPLGGSCGCRSSR